jgi:CDP-paratose 2-epimerase
MSLILVTGSCGLVGSAVTDYFHQRGWRVAGIDCNKRRDFFGPEGDVSGTLERLRGVPCYHHFDVDVGNRRAVMEIVKDVSPDVIVHTAAQPSHDRAAAIPFEDFETNAVGTLNLLEAARQFCREAPFVHMSTNKVYGDWPNRVGMRAGETRWEITEPRFVSGVAEDMPVDQTMHSLFGASKLAADVLVQEYGRYFGMPTCCLRAGCLTGPGHAGVEAHGFLSYLIRCNVQDRLYRVYGYGGRQVRDNLHADDIAGFAWEFIQKPRSAEVYNIGGGYQNSCSILEAFDMASDFTRKMSRFEYAEARLGDHICYYSDLRKIRSHYPDWQITKTLPAIFKQIAARWMDSTHAGVVS